MKGQHETLALRIRESRKKQKLSQEQLAERIGYSGKSMISKIESGVVDLPQSRIYQIAYALNVSPYYLIGMTDDPTYTYEVPYDNSAKRYNDAMKKLYEAYSKSSFKIQLSVCMLLDLEHEDIPPQQ